MSVADGAQGYVRIVSALIAATFGVGDSPPGPPQPQNAGR
jgi:hypothetical protein